MTAPLRGQRRLLQWQAEKRAQALAGVFTELSGLPPGAAAQELKAPAGGKWHALRTSGYLWPIALRCTGGPGYGLK